MDKKLTFLLHISKKSCTFAASKVNGKEITMDESVFVKFNSEEERLAALRRMVGLRKVWDARVRELMEKYPEMQVAQ